MPDVILRIDLQGRVVFINDKALQISGYSREDLEGKDMLPLVAPEDRARLLKNTRRMMDDKLPPQEYQVVMKDGRMVSFEVHGEVLRDADLTPLGFVYVCRDMTERKKMYEMLFQSEEKFSKIFMTTPECIAITRLADGEVVDVNRGFEEITGWKRSEAIGRTTWDTNIWLEASARERMVQDLQTGLDVRHREFQFRRSDGSVRTGIYSARPIHIAGEACVIFIFQDITDQRQLEEERQKLEQQLIQSQKAEAIGTLAGGIAHDFNNILGVIIGYTELAAMQPEVSAMQGYQERVLNACERAKSLVRQILTFARHTESERNPLDLRLLAKESLKLLDSTIPATIEIRQQIADRAYTINGDPTQMHQILMNLCTNAVHAMGEKGGVLEVGLSHEDFTDGTAQQIPGLKTRPLCEACRVRHGGRHRSGHHGPHFRPVLHDKISRQRNGSRPVRGVRHRPESRRGRNGDEQAWRKGTNLHRLYPRRRGKRGRRKRGWRPIRLPPQAAANASSSWTTKRSWRNSAGRCSPPWDTK